MDSQRLEQIAHSTAARYGVTLDQSAIQVLTQRVQDINSRRYITPVLEHHAVESALQVIFVAAAQNGLMHLDGAELSKILSGLCPLPPFC